MDVTLEKIVVSTYKDELLYSQHKDFFFRKKNLNLNLNFLF